MKKFNRIGFVLFAVTLLLAGCGNKSAKTETKLTDEMKLTDDFSAENQEEVETTGSGLIEIKKDGNIIYSIEEAFDKDYYDEDALNEYVVGEVAKYNNQAGNKNVQVKKLDVKKDRAILKMEFKTDADFESFNGYPFFCGTVEDAFDQGYDMDVELEKASVKKGSTGETIGESDLMKMETRSIAILRAPRGEELRLKTERSILYVKGATLEKKNVAVITGDVSYIVFR